MADTPYPYYRMQASGPDETGYSLVIQIQQGAGGGLEGLTSEEDVIAAVRGIFDGRDGVSSTLTRYSVATNTL
ncbi:hypothetical protein [Streptomyces sp. NRRL S-337]|uniref:hypothetical protein n=1 Tax=Streptomyces sp. NRRL S-337 TaxID=1463900 RepID=UPI0004C905DD|nr:hypothetical protein [Streptomyces sp. NRRL S-337]